MQLEIDGLSDGDALPEPFAFGIKSAEGHVRLGENRNPGLRWEQAPEGTRSFVIICVDTDVPTSGEDVNKEGRTVPEDLPRGRFYHWVMVDVPPETTRIEDSACSSGVTPGGKSDPPGPEGSRQGRNDYTDWFAGDKQMGGTYLGYDGACPPWNDERLHHYHFVVYATDLERCPVDGAFSGGDVEAALQGHVLEEARVTLTYTLNPSLST
jgi:Raf kinase inhibitor-like YbhB/YbcL family protein